MRRPSAGGAASAGKTWPNPATDDLEFTAAAATASTPVRRPTSNDTSVGGSKSGRSRRPSDAGATGRDLDDSVDGERHEEVRKALVRTLHRLDDRMRRQTSGVDRQQDHVVATHVEAVGRGPHLVRERRVHEPHLGEGHPEGRHLVDTDGLRTLPVATERRGGRAGRDRASWTTAPTDDEGRSGQSERHDHERQDDQRIRRLAHRPNSTARHRGGLGGLGGGAVVVAASEVVVDASTDDEVDDAVEAVVLLTVGGGVVGAAVVGRRWRR